MTVGERIRRRREELDWTLEELGEKIGVQRSAVLKYEKDQIDLRLSTIRKLHDALGLSYLELLDDDDGEDQDLISAFRKASECEKNMIRRALDLPERKKDSEQSAI